MGTARKSMPNEDEWYVVCLLIEVLSCWDGVAIGIRHRPGFVVHIVL